jgi:histone H2A
MPAKKGVKKVQTRGGKSAPVNKKAKVEGKGKVEKTRAAVAQQLQQGKFGKAGVTFPVGRLHRMLKYGNYADRIGASAPVFLAGLLEYLTVEVLELAGNATRDNKKGRITPRHIMLAVRGDDEMNALFADVTIASAGVVPHIHKKLLNEGGKGKKGDE